MSFVPKSFAESRVAVDTNEAKATRLIAYLKKHSGSLQSKGSNHYYRQVLWQLLAIDFKTLSGPLKRELMALLFTWSGSNLNDADRASLEIELKRKLEGDLDEYWDKLRLATLKEVDASDLSKDLRAALKEAFGKLRMTEAGMKRLEIFDKDEERFVNEMLFAGIMPSQSSDLAQLGNNLITNLAGNVISGNFTADQLATMAANIAKVLGIQNSTTGKLLQEAVNSKVIQDEVGAAKMPEILTRVSDIRSKLDSRDTGPTFAPTAPPKRQSLGDLYEAAEKRDGSRQSQPSSHSANSAANIKTKSPLKLSRTSPSTPIRDLNISDSAPAGSKSEPMRSSAQPNPPPAPKADTKKEDPKIQAAQEIIDPRELLGGAFVYKNPKFTATDPNLVDQKNKVLGPIESKHFEEARQASIKSGPKIGTCDVSVVKSDKYCEQCGPDSKPCRCYEGMLKTVREYDMKKASAADSADVVEARLKETGLAVESAVQAEFRKKAVALERLLADEQLSAHKRKKIESDLEAIKLQEKQASTDRAFYLKKVLLNGVMNTKTPACILNKRRYGTGAKRDPATEPEWIYPDEKYCHQFDLKPNEPFESLSKQDGIMLRLALATLEGLEDANRSGNMKVTKFDELYSPTFKIDEHQVCSSRKLCELPKRSSRKDLYYRIFADESQDKKVRDIFDGETENTIARTILRCFGPREWGGMITSIWHRPRRPVEARPLLA